MATIELRNITKQYRQAGNVINALDDVSLTIDGGEFLSIVGRSGSGKTTLLDICGLLMRPTSGQVFIDGADAASLPERRRAELRGRAIGFVFQEYNLIPTLDVLGNVMLPLRYSGGDRRDGRDRAMGLLQAVGMSDRVGHRPDQLSGGQQQRVAIARSLIQRPALLLADEPTGAVDTQTAAELLDMLRGLSREDGVTVAIVTHDLDLAASTDRTVRLQDGRVVEDSAGVRVAAA
ncbi:MAG: ABC transporter ATP-binding protein [Candidatus Dormibacteraeota bacterium]|uniref:ABC transporter ATP-binding protein n=1 Tax=Candidatus Amunia macphersoniae TaxID=3127014 RepID=A0A934KPS4_9BACT|nr:ABC transporter ATP-binding protein [Candidatus Dormibacteraeota bacterium]